METSNIPYNYPMLFHGYGDYGTPQMVEPTSLNLPCPPCPAPTKHVTRSPGAPGTGGAGAKWLTVIQDGWFRMIPNLVGGWGKTPLKNMS